METPVDYAPTSRRGPPGQRFQNRYWRHRTGRNQRSMLARIASLLLGGLLVIIGVALLVLPGPGLLCLAGAGALFASESLRVARSLDWLEVRARAAWRRTWNRPRRDDVSKPR